MSFLDKESKKIWNSEFSKKYPIDIQKKAKIKMELLNSIQVLDEQKIPIIVVRPLPNGEKVEVRLGK